LTYILAHSICSPLRIPTSELVLGGNKTTFCEKFGKKEQNLISKMAVCNVSPWRPGENYFAPNHSNEYKKRKTACWRKKIDPSMNSVLIASE
jgi:hypothetical protein